MALYVVYYALREIFGGEKGWGHMGIEFLFSTLCFFATNHDYHEIPPVFIYHYRSLNSSMLSTQTPVIDLVSCNPC